MTDEDGSQKNPPDIIFTTIDNTKALHKMYIKWKELNFTGIYFLELQSMIDTNNVDIGTLFRLNALKEHPVFSKS